MEVCRVSETKVSRPGKEHGIAKGWFS